jgi:hypothetical protein
MSLGAWVERRYSSYTVSTLVLDGGEWLASRPGRALPPVPIRPRAGLDTEATGKIIYLCWGSNLDHRVVQPVARNYTDWATRLTKSTLGLLIINSNMVFWTLVLHESNLIQRETNSSVVITHMKLTLY